jgi:hypothetical protein
MPNNKKGGEDTQVRENGGEKRTKQAMAKVYRHKGMLKEKSKRQKGLDKR